MSDPKVQTREIGPLSVRAAVGSTDAEQRTVKVQWTTGAKVLRATWNDGQFWEELSLDPSHVDLNRLNNGAPFLANHDGMDVARTLGVVERAWLEPGSGYATVRFAKAGVDANADQVFQKIQDGIIRNVSVGYRVHKFEKVSGATGEIPTYRATAWEPIEISAVAVGADAGAGFRSEKTQFNTCAFQDAQQERNVSDEKKPAEVDVKAPAENTRAVEVQKESEKAADAERVIAAVKVEKERAAGIMHAVRTAGLDVSFAERLTKEGVSLSDARAQVLEELAKRSEATPTHTRSAIEVGEVDASKFQRGVTAWLLEKAGNGLVAKAKTRGVEGFKDLDLDGGHFRGMSISDVARECLTRRGVSTRGVYDQVTLFNMALRAGASTGDFSVLLEDALRKSMRAAYAVQDDTWRRVCGTESVKDFKDANRYLNGSFESLPVVNESEEYKQILIPDGSKVQISTETRGAKISISRQALINDDMGALVDLAVRFGRAAGRSIEVAFYELLLQNSGLGPTMSDSNPFFHASRGNVGTGSALSIAGLDADRQLMRSQMDAQENEYLDIVPSIALVPLALESSLKVINASAYDHDSTKLQKPNAVQGMFSDIVASPRLSDATRRYLFCSEKEAFKVVFLQGAGEGPVMESRNGFDVDGIEWKARIDFKVNPYDPKHALTNAGT